MAPPGGGGGVKEKGEEPSLEQQPPARKLNSPSGARSLAGSDGGGACAPMYIFILFYISKVSFSTHFLNNCNKIYQNI